MSNEAYTGTVRLTVAQATIRFLSNQYSERDGVEHRLRTKFPTVMPQPKK